MTYTNPGPSTRVCPTCGDVWLRNANPVLAHGITLSSDCEYEARCVICDAVTVGGLAEKETQNEEQ